MCPLKKEAKKIKMGGSTGKSGRKEKEGQEKKKWGGLLDTKW